MALESFVALAFPWQDRLDGAEYQRLWRVLDSRYRRRIDGDFHARGVRCSHDRQDLTQQTLWIASRTWANFDPRRGSVPSWLLGIARKSLAAFRRASARLMAPSEAIEVVADAARTRPLEETPFENLELHLAGLDARARRIVRARYLDGLTASEIAAREQAEGKRSTRRAIEGVLSRSLRRLRSDHGVVPEARRRSPASGGAEMRGDDEPKPLDESVDPNSPDFFE